MIICRAMSLLCAGFSLDVNQSYTQQGLGESKGGGKVRSVYRREIESHNLVIPIHWLTLQEVLGEGLPQKPHHTQSSIILYDFYKTCPICQYASDLILLYCMSMESVLPTVAAAALAAYPPLPLTIILYFAHILLIAFVIVALAQEVEHWDM